MAQIEYDNNKAYAVLTRLSESAKTDSYIFCGEDHKHGITDGHRVAHCHSKPVSVVVGSKHGKDIVVNNADGYMVRSRLKLRPAKANNTA